MNEDLFVTDDLSRQMLDAGHDLTDRLKSQGIVVLESLWVSMPKYRTWRLLLELPISRKIGPKETYRLIQKTIDKTPEGIPKIDLKDITVHDSLNRAFTVCETVVLNNG